MKPEFKETFETLRDMLQRHGRGLKSTVDTPSEFVLASADKVDRSGRPLFVAGVQIKKNYVSYHLMPIYADPKLLTTVSPDLRKRMQGKGCFNFRSIEPPIAKELSGLTKEGIKRFASIELPWAGDAKRDRRRKK